MYMTPKEGHGSSRDSWAAMATWQSRCTHFEVLDHFEDVNRKSPYIVEIMSTINLRACVRAAKQTATHRRGPAGYGPADPTCVRIVEDEHGVFLFREDSEGRCISDTWHVSVDEAKKQARFEYELSEWTEVTTEMDKGPL